MREAGAAVEAEERHAGVVADASVPDAPSGDVYVTLVVRGCDFREGTLTGWASAEHRTLTRHVRQAQDALASREMRI